MYEKFFGFTDKPFNVTPDPRFLYLSPGHQEALASMIYGINERRGFVSIIGEIGTGKTTLLHTLFNELGPDVKTVFIFNTKINFKQLLLNILIELKIKPESDNKALLINQLYEYLIERLSLNEIVAIIIDEAQNLSPKVMEELRMLSNLETPREKLLQILFIGQPELDFKLRSTDLRQLKQRIGINCYLTPLNYEEQLKYIAHRLTVVGSSTDNIFSQKALELICQNAHGIPRIINILCDNALLSAYSRGIHRINPDIMKEVISDYERKESPLNEMPVESYNANNYTKPEKRRKTAITALSLFLILLVLLFLGFFFYMNGSNTLSRILNTLFPPLSLTSQQNQSTSANMTAPEIVQKIVEPSTPLQENMSTLQPIELVKKTPIEEVLKMTENASPSEQTDNLPEGESIPPHQLPVKELSHAFDVQEGDIVSALALVQYGTINDTIFDIVKRANPDIVDLNRIEIGQKINFPTLDVDNFIIENENGMFSIHIATFTSYDQAKSLLNTLVKKNHSSSLSPAKVFRGKLSYRVTVGNFSSRLQAIEYAKSTKLDRAFYMF